jgi:F-type H+-transporting ATPase subunit a
MELTPKVKFLGLEFDLTVISVSLLAAVVVFLIAILTTRRLAMRPSGAQNFIEMIIEFSREISRMSFDAKIAERYLAFTFTLFLYILIANQIGVIMMASAEVHHPIPSLGITEESLKISHGVSLIKSPTADPSVPFAFAIAIALFAHYVGIRSNWKGYLKSYLNPLHWIEEVAKPATHAMRLWANIFAGEVLIHIMLTKGPIYLTGAPLLVWMGFSLFVGVIQAYIFTVLANVYISQKMYSH